MRLDGDEPRIMLHRHLKLKSLMQFGGHVELNEHPWQAFTRELREEAGYDIEQLEILQPRDAMTHLSDVVILLPQPLYIIDVGYGKALNHFHDDIAWAFATDEPPGHQLDKDESQDIVLLSRSQIVDLGGTEVLADVAEVALFIFDTVLPTWRRSPAPLLPSSIE
jgi:8-oxo-dGTP diphosphatase